MKNKDSQNLNYMRGILLSLFSIISLIIIFYLYSRNTLPGNNIFINHSLYTFAETVLLMFGVCIFFTLIGIKRALFSKEYYNFDPSKIIYYIQSSFKPQRYKTLFIIITVGYFIFFGFLSNLFIFFNNDGTAFSLFPSHTHHYMNMKNMKNMNVTSKINYPYYNLIICCNSIGYVPMLILSVNSNFSFLLIPMNFLLGLIISILVGLNMTFNVYILKQIRSIKLSRRNLLGLVGISSGLFVGCPTCAGSFFYSIAGFSSLITFSFLSAYQIVFIIISIPLLILNMIIMAKVLQRKFCNSCKIK